MIVAGHNKALVEVDIEQKTGVRFKGEGGRDFTLYRPVKYTENGRISANVLCEVLSINSDNYPYLKRKDMLLVHHNFFDESNGYFVSKNLETKKALFTIPVTRNFFARILKDGTVEPICENVIVERIFEPVPSSIIIVPDSYKKTFSDRFKVVASSKECLKNGINVGDVVLTFIKSDYEVCYNWDREDKTVIKVWQEDIFAKMAGNVIEPIK